MHFSAAQLSRDSLIVRDLVGHHRMRGSASPVLMATHHSEGSPRLSDVFPSRLWGNFTQNGSNNVYSRNGVPFAFAVNIVTLHTP